MSKDIIPSFEECEKAVRERVADLRRAFPREEVEAYLDSDEAQREIVCAYKSAIKSYEAGEIYAEYILSNVVGSAGLCLSLMF